MVTPATSGGSAALNPSLMKTLAHRRLFFTGLLGCAVAGRLLAAEPARPLAKVEVEFSHPEKFTDVKESASDFENERGGGEYLPLLKEHLLHRAQILLPAGQTLTVTFSDIDLAGDFEPWHGPQFDQVRILKDLYVPRLTFRFTLADASGKVLKEGERKLVDLAYQMRMTSGFRSDSLRYEKEMLSDWLRSEFKSPQG